MPPETGLGDSAREHLVLRALAGWSAAAEARVHSVVTTRRRAAVNLLVNGDYEYVELFQRDRDGLWIEAGSSSGHVDEAHLDQ
ncbi:hypothetical protein DQ237_18325 [Blastococcus sp. TF02-8]|uniref:hypothetical protein n=1 Tax=Blastococcus sp. TF02-8 TaxID=2250574 RepID=UPI000DE8CF91|nr:hypothetical protein [Blastococcus sp. TF02-8]RBY93403.1 hypothetical protein DQ237_18325 [Blastococcus sp. TF02-8]